jgi:PAS domain S-box-containing protein
MRTTKRRRPRRSGARPNLRRRLAETEKTLEALRSESVDALVVSRRRKRRLLQLDSSDLTYQRMIEQMSEGAATLALDGTILYCNRRFAEMLRTPLKKIPGSSIYDHVAPDLIASVKPLLAKAAKEPAREESLLRRPDDSQFPVLLSLNPLVGYEAPAVSMLAADLTLEHERRQHLIAAIEELEAFNYSVSHDLRAPLRSIAGFSEALRRGYPEVLDERGKDYLGRIEKAVRRMSGLIDAMMLLSRAALADLVREEVDLSALARSIGSELTEAQPERQVRLSVEPGMRTSADRALTEIALRCLIENAWKFTAHSPDASIEVAAVRNATPPTFCVRDNGAGFEQDYVHKIFQPFQRLHTKEEFAGTGIGLSLVQRIVQRHGGRVWARSRPGKGAAFYFTLGPNK